MEIDKNTTIFINKKDDSNIYYVEIADNLKRKKIANIELEKITSIRYHVRKVQSY